MRKILITGGTVFVSKYVARYFVENGDEVYVINRNSRVQIDGVRLIECDRLNLGDKLKSIWFDVVIDITAYTENHVRALNEALGEFGDYIFISSSAVYPETNPQPFCETQVCGKNFIWGDYGTNKIAAENYLIKNIPNAYILRPPYFYGVFENLYRELFVFDCAVADRPFYLPQGGNMKLQFFNVSDLCRFIEILLSTLPKNHIFNLGNKECVTVREWATLCYKAAGKIPNFVSVDKSFNQRDYFCFYNYEYVLDVSAQCELMPDTMPLEQGLMEEFKWYTESTDKINKKPYFKFIDDNLK